MRPLPPSERFFGFQPDQDGLGQWVRSTFIDPSSPLANPDHAHLEHASIGWLWTDEPASHHGRQIIGEARLVSPKQENWSSAMKHHWLRQWFGGRALDFTITIQAEAARDMDDASFCALIEHELYHCAQAMDEYASPRFRRDGSPIFAMRAHDVEEFVGIVERYGAGAASSNVALMAAAATRRPTVGPASIATACGTCRLKLVG